MQARGRLYSHLAMFLPMFFGCQEGYQHLSLAGYLGPSPRPPQNDHYCQLFLRQWFLAAAKIQ